MLVAANTALEARLATEISQRLDSLANRLSALDPAAADARISTLENQVRQFSSTSGDTAQFQAETAAWTRTMQAAMEGVQARLSGAEARLASLSARRMDSSAELDLAELDFVLRLAQERLQLFHDTKTANQALAIAQRHLEAFDNPMYLALRNEIATARRELAAVATADFAGIYTGIDDIQSSLVSLPFRTDSQTTEMDAITADAGWWERITGALSNLVTVRRSEEVADADALALADQELIRQRAWLEAETARLAALRQDQAAYSAAFKRLLVTLQRWFQPGTPQMTPILQRISELQSQPVDPAMPDISAPWAALQAMRASGLTAPAVAPLPGQPAADQPEPLDSAADPEEPSAAESAAPSGDTENVAETTAADAG